jgi:glycosyltransferase involved in cell wall biosynthesis
MRILMVTPSYYPIVGGTETLVQQLALKLNERRGVHADVMTFNMEAKWIPSKKEEIREEEGFKVFRVSALNAFEFRSHSPYSMLFNIHVIPKLNFVREFGKYDVIHFHDDIDLSFPLFSYFLRMNKEPKLLHCHSLAFTYERYRRNFLSGNLLRRVADLYVGSSSYSIRLLLNLGLPKAKLTTLPNAVDTKVFRPDENKKVDNVILYVARIVRYKGLVVLLRALFHLNIETHVIIIGPVGDPLYFSEVQHLIQKINAETRHRVAYLGLVDRNTFIKWFQKASVFVCPSLLETFGTVNLEALACGTPVIATRVGGIPDVVKDGVNGILVPPNDPLALASALQKLLENKKSRELYGRAGRKIVEKCFSWNFVLEELIKIYERLTMRDQGCARASFGS